jgi:penicillin-binding protein 1A
MTSMSFRRSRWTRLLLLAVGFLVSAGAGGSAAFCWLFLRDLPDPHSVADYQPPLASTVFDRDGRPIGEFYRERRRLVRFEEVPKHVIDAFVSAEDSAFFEHEGIDYPGILRAAWRNFVAGGKVEGASTITQQMVKGLLLSPERTYTRKIREMILARRIEQRFTKQEILFLYLNQIYFGSGAYGVGEAARSYFDKPVTELTISEGAQLAGLPKAPSRYSPFRNPELGERRRRYVLDRMFDDGAIDAAAHREAIQTRPEFVDGANDPDFAVAAYFTEEVRRYLFELLGGDAVLEGGLRIETTLDIELQRAAVESVQRGLEALDRRNGYRGPLRRVESAEIEAEITRLAEENDLLPDEDVDEATPDEDVAEVAPDLEIEPEDPIVSLPEEVLLVGVVTEVDAKANRARVAFAPDVRGIAALDDVDWARPMNPDSLPWEVKEIGTIFSVGDVARFRVLPAEEDASDDEPEEDSEVEPPLRLTLMQDPLVEGALLSLDVASGDVLSLVGGYDFARSQFNRATQARRQPGSAFKPLVYGTALSLSGDEGLPLYTPASIVHDRPKVYTDHSTGFIWKPKNYGREFYGPITLRRALAKSINNAAVHLCDEVGVGSVMRYARRLGIRSPLEASLALALGTSGVTLLELTRAYAVFPNGGRRVTPRFLVSVVDRDGNVLVENAVLDDPIEKRPEVAADSGRVDDDAAAGDGDGDADLESVEAVDLAETAEEAMGEPETGGEDDRLLPPEQAYLMTDMLRAVVVEGTGRRATRLGRPLGGKTGTTNDQADAWFVGFSPEVATGVWVGFDEVRFLGAGETGSKAALPVWIDFMEAAHEGHPKRDFSAPGNGRIVWARIDRETGLLASRASKSTVFQPFIAGTEPTRRAAAVRETDRALQDLREDSFGSDSALRMQLDAF